MFQLLADKKDLMEFKIAAPLILFSKSFLPVIIVGNVLFSTLNMKKVVLESTVLQIYFLSLSMGRKTSCCENGETNDEQKDKGGGQIFERGGGKKQKSKQLRNLFTKKSSFSPHYVAILN